MDDAAPVRGHERVRDLPDDDQHVLRRPRLVRAEELAQGRPLHELHHHEELVLGQPEVEHGDDVRRADRGDGEDLALEALHHVARVRVLLLEHLERHVAPGAELARAEDVGESALAHVCDQLVAVLEALANADGHVAS
jgi:hypothetical protein